MSLLDSFSFTLKGEINDKSGELQQEYKPLHNVINSQNILEDFVSNELKFNCAHPAQIEIQKSYDDSVNLIINDGDSYPKLINTRFSVTEDNKYKIIDRSGDQDTNLYERDNLISHTSLFKIYKNFPKLRLKSIISSGNLKVGQYVVYIKYADADGNETNIAGESGLIPCFIGYDNRVNGAYADFNTNKSICITVDNIDVSYDYIQVYYSRYSSDQFELTNTSIFKIIEKVPILKRKSIDIIINGNENTQEITPTELNTDYEAIQSAHTQAINNNRLLLGNVNKTTIDYDNLTDLSLRFYPTLEDSEQLNVDYYNPQKVHNKVGYWDEEIYRFGIVYIYNNNNLSPVFNILGINKLYSEKNSCKDFLEKWRVLDSEGNRQYVIYDKDTYAVSNTTLDYNIKGVSRIISSHSGNIIGIKFQYDTDIIDELKKQGIVGFFFVRQKRIPTILCEAYVLPHSSYMGLPLNKNKSIQCIISGEKTLRDEALPKTYNCKTIDSYAYCLICPEFEVRQPYYNQLFNTSRFVVSQTQNNFFEADLVAVKEGVPYMSMQRDNNSIKFSSQAGTAEDATKFAYDYDKYSELKKNWGKNTNVPAVIRGIFGPYVGAVIPTEHTLNIGEIVKIYIPNYSTDNVDEYFKIRYNDNSPYYTISDRYELTDELETCYRGDCYYCSFTHRLIRNFQDTSAPNNDELVSTNGYKNLTYEDGAWKTGDGINLGDINAIKLGEWVTVKVRSTCNLAIRSVDDTNASEIALTGKPRSFYPYSSTDSSGNSKIPDSYFINEGFSQSLGQRYYFLKADVPQIRNNFTNQVMYSDIGVNDGYQNGLRVFRIGNHRDYNTSYGSLTKIINFNGTIILVFQHGICTISQNEQNGLKQVQSDNEINVYNILPEIPTVVSDIYGAKYIESVIQTSKGIYGLDTDAKRIWRLSSNGFEIISDNFINSFLQKNINLSISNNSVNYSIENRKVIATHYNVHKQDVMFTIYDTNSTSWNICYNELLQRWITFYSWVPLVSCNINNIMYTFDAQNTGESNWLYKHNVGAQPCYWYGEQHPFEFEFSVIDNPLTHKIFDNLIIISNNSEPESFHYTIVGDCYNFAEQKNFMYFRQEATNALLQANVQNYYIKPDEEFLTKTFADLPARSALFPIVYYTEKPDNNKLYSQWVEMTDVRGEYSYAHLSGTTLNRNGQEISITEHSPAKDIRKVGRLLGNMHYREDRWFVQISPINVLYKNEGGSSNHGRPRIVLSNVPKSLYGVSISIFPESLGTYHKWDIDLTDWGTLYNKQAKTREEIKLKDKYMKVKIRYKGDKQTFIHSVLTKYTEVL